MTDTYYLSCRPIIALLGLTKKGFFASKTRFFVDKILWKMWITPILEALLQCLQRLRLP